LLVQRDESVRLLRLVDSDAHGHVILTEDAEVTVFLGNVDLSSADLDLVALFLTSFVSNLVSAISWLVSFGGIVIKLLTGSRLVLPNVLHILIFDAGLALEGLNLGGSGTSVNDSLALNTLEVTTGFESVSELGPLHNSVARLKVRFGGIKSELELERIGSGECGARIELNLELLEALSRLLGGRVNDLPLVVGELLLPFLVSTSGGGSIVLRLGQEDLELGLDSFDGLRRWRCSVSHRWEELHTEIDVVDIVEDVLELLSGSLVVDEINRACGPGILVAIIVSLVVLVVGARTEESLVLGKLFLPVHT
jgi:hypothetical protein